MIIYEVGSKFKKFYLKDLFTNELAECTEKEFDDCVTTHRNLYEIKYEDPNTQLYMLDGVVEAKRER